MAQKSAEVARVRPPNGASVASLPRLPRVGKVDGWDREAVAIEEELRRYLRAPESARDCSAQVFRIIEMLHRHLFDPSLNVKVLAALCGIGDHNFSTKFRNEVGTTVREYIETLRLSAARYLLTHSDLSVVEIARRVGYEHAHTFYRAFERRFRCTPGSISTSQVIPHDGAQLASIGPSLKKWRTLSALVDRILPSVGGSGAHAANVVGYVRWLFAQRELSSDALQFESGLDLVDELCRFRNGVAYCTCDHKIQDAILTELMNVDAGVMRRFLTSLVRVTLAGFLCDPKYGGNRDSSGWKHIGFTMCSPSTPDRVTV